MNNRGFPHRSATPLDGTEEGASSVCSHISATSDVDVTENGANSVSISW
jgi:hypothetical protein